METRGTTGGWRQGGLPVSGHVPDRAARVWNMVQASLQLHKPSAPPSLFAAGISETLGAGARDLGFGARAGLKMWTWETSVCFGL